MEVFSLFVYINEWISLMRRELGYGGVADTVWLEKKASAGFWDLARIFSLRNPFPSPLAKWLSLVVVNSTSIFCWYNYFVNLRGGHTE